MRRATRWVIGGAMLLGAVLQGHAAGVQHALLVQNSGWMEPFYADPASRFKPLVEAVARAVAAPEDTVHLLAFNQTTPANTSPRLLATLQGAEGVAQSLASLEVARKGTSPALADTDFKEAVARTITGPFAARPGIVWIFTNNRNSPNNDAQTAERNRDFYRLLHLEPSITRTMAFPLRMPVQGRLYAARGLMVYALAYGAPAAQALESIMARGELAKVLTQPPARLKPLDVEAVRIVPEAVRNGENLRVSLGADQRTIVLDAQSQHLVPQVTLSAALQNLFYPYAIRAATVQAALTGTGGTRVPVQVAPEQVHDLQPGARQPVQVRLTLPMAQVPPAWSMQAISGLGKRLLLPMTVEIALTQQQLGVSEAFVTQMRELFPGDPLSEVFTPPQEVRSSQVRIPLLVRVQYPLAPVLALLGAVIVSAAGLAALLLWSRRSRRYDLVVDGARRPVMLSPFGRQPVHDARGLEIGRVRCSWGRPQVVSVAAGHEVTFARGR